jgi:hypothetical protein
MPLKVLISHAHAERPVAQAWKALLETISLGAVDTPPGGGMQIGDEWREQLRRRIAESDFVLAVLSPQTRDRPWILWECGVANGAAQECGGSTGVVIPVVHSMASGDLANPLSSFQIYRATSGPACRRSARGSSRRPALV